MTVAAAAARVCCAPAARTGLPARGAVARAAFWATRARALAPALYLLHAALRPLRCSPPRPAAFGFAPACARPPPPCGLPRLRAFPAPRAAWPLWPPPTCLRAAPQHAADGAGPLPRRWRPAGAVRAAPRWRAGAPPPPVAPPPHHTLRSRPAAAPACTCRARLPARGHRARLPRAVPPAYRAAVPPAAARLLPPPRAFIRLCVPALLPRLPLHCRATAHAGRAFARFAHAAYHLFG